jgi:Protein prenyltransferase alpha subunit repeat
LYSKLKSQIQKIEEHKAALTMHGRNRAEYKARQNDPIVAAKVGIKAQQLRVLTDKVLALSSSPDEDVQMVLELTSKLVLVHPDPLVIWNRRRSALQRTRKSAEQLVSSVSESPLPPWLLSELSLTAAALQQGNPKAYGAWFHRKWCIQQYTCEEGSKSAQSQQLLDQELTLTAQFLQRDERNFHCWNYRRFIVGCLLSSRVSTSESSSIFSHFDGSWSHALSPLLSESAITAGHVASMKMGPQIGFASKAFNVEPTAATSSAPTDTEKINFQAVHQLVQQEWDFTTKKIHDNFSNSSAFHYRSLLLPILLELDISVISQPSKSISSSAPPSVATSPTSINNYWHHYTTLCEERLTSEMELATNAIFTETDDQSAWWYHSFLLKMLVASLASCVSSIGASSSAGFVHWVETTLAADESNLQELAKEVGHRSKWVLLGLYQALWAKRELSLCLDRKEQLADILAHQSHLLDRLVALDPDRMQRYHYLRRRYIQEK